MSELDIFLRVLNTVLNLFRLVYQIHQDKKRAAAAGDGDGSATEK